MADDHNELRTVNWTEVFSFTHIFKSFRMAIHLSKLLLALAAIVLLFCTGWLMDRIWSGAGSYTMVVDRQGRTITGPEAFFVAPSAAYDQGRQQWLESRKPRAAQAKADAYNARHSLMAYSTALRGQIETEQGRTSYLLQEFVKLRDEATKDHKPMSADAEAIKEKDWSDNLADASEDFSEEIRRVEDMLKRARENAREAIEKDAALKTADEREEASDLLDEDYHAGLRAIVARKLAFKRRIESIRGLPVFESLCEYESRCLGNAVAAVVRADFTPGLDAYQAICEAKSGRGDARMAAAPAAGPLLPDNAGGFAYWLIAAAYGLLWFAMEHWLYALVFGLIALAVWSVFGGAIYRMAALHAAREEKISIAQALRFSIGKFLSFFMAPLIPLAIILFLGGLLIVGGLLGNLWGFGAIIVGILFFLAVIVGLIIAFLAIGLAAGKGLMYPTIAVEGSDSFDAISRSFSYVFAKPWRAILYGTVALVYGALTYLFVRFFAFLALAATHRFAKLGIWQGGETVRGAWDKLDVMWPAPTYSSFHGPLSWEAMSAWEQIGAFIIGIWVYLVIGMVLAFVLSYCASATTMVYYLLRRKVDATDLDDVYVEEEEEEAFEPIEPAGEAQEDESSSEESAGGEGESSEGEGKGENE